MLKIVEAYLYFTKCLPVRQHGRREVVYLPKSTSGKKFKVSKVRKGILLCRKILTN